MAEMTTDSLIKALRAAGSPYAEAIAEGLAAGSMRIEPSGFQRTGHGSVKELRRIYGVRKNHLAQFTSEHGRALHRDVTALCENLAATTAEQCDGFFIRTGRPGENYLVFVEPSSGQVFGCCHVFSQLEMTAEEREKLWNG
jgi:hypothetical protein